MNRKLLNNLDYNIKNIINDYLYGDYDYFKSKFNKVLADIKLHNPKFIVYTLMCDSNNIFFNYRRVKHLDCDIDCLRESIEHFKFSNKIKHEVLKELKNRNHPHYEYIELELLD